MTSRRDISVLIGKNGLLVAFLLGLLAAAVGCGAAATTTHPVADLQQTAAVSLSTRCQNQSSRRPPEFSKGDAPKGQPILVGPIVVGCAKRLGEPIRFIAYVQATGKGGEQLCYVLDQMHQKALTGGSCFPTASSSDICREDCSLSVEATVAGWGGQGAKGSLVTGARTGVIEEVALSTSPVGNKQASAPFVVVLDGAVQKTLRLQSVVSLFASAVIPCLPAGQVAQASGDVSGEKFVMRGSDPFGCHE